MIPGPRAPKIKEAIDKEIDALTSNLVKLRATLQKALDDAAQDSHWA